MVISIDPTTIEGIKGIIGLLITLAAAVAPIVLAIRNGQQKQEARDVAFMEVERRKLVANPDTVPVSQYSPPTGTGDGGLDKKVMEFLAKSTPPPGDSR